jgi:phospholipid transport system substrate-binding protein
MRLSIRSLLCLLAAGAAVLAAPARAGPDAGVGPAVPPDILVKTVTLEVVDLIARDEGIKSGSREKLLQLVDEKVLPHFDFVGMTAHVAGQAWKKADAGQKKRLAQEFKTLLVRTYAATLQAYSGQKLEFRPLRARPCDTDVVVTVRVMQPGAQPVPIDYSMEKSEQGWKVYDVAVGGVSLIANYRTAFTPRLRDSGIEGLIAELQRKNHPEVNAQASKQ